MLLFSVNTRTAQENQCKRSVTVHNLLNTAVLISKSIEIVAEGRFYTIWPNKQQIFSIKNSNEENKLYYKKGEELKYRDLKSGVTTHTYRFPNESEIETLTFNSKETSLTLSDKPGEFIKGE